MIALWLLACSGGEPPQWQRGPMLQGPVGIGYGHAVAWAGDELMVGAPLDPSGGHLFRDQAEVARGTPEDFLGSALLGGAQLRVAAPRHQDGRGAVLDAAGLPVWVGEPGQGLGSRPVGHRGGLAAIEVGGVASQAGDGWSESGRLWSLASVDLGEGPRLVAGRVDGRLSVGGQAIGDLDPVAELGYALSACPQRGEGRLAIGVPGRDEVWLVHQLDEAGLDEAIVIEGPEGTRFGHAVTCVNGPLWIGAPGPGGGVFHVADPLQPEIGWSWTGSTAAEQAGFSLAASEDGQLAVGAPGAARVYRFRPVP